MEEISILSQTSLAPILRDGRIGWLGGKSGPRTWMHATADASSDLVHTHKKKI